MTRAKKAKKKWREMTAYERFRRILGIVLLSVLVVYLLFIVIDISCDFRILAGYSSSAEYYQKDVFQDSTDYAEYYYEENKDDHFRKSKYYEKLTKEKSAELTYFLDDFERCLYLHRADYEKWYSFSRDFIDGEDYCSITFRYPENKLESYNIYYYDMQSHTLYFFHSNY